MNKSLLGVYIKISTSGSDLIFYSSDDGFIVIKCLCNPSFISLIPADELIK